MASHEHGIEYDDLGLDEDPIEYIRNRRTFMQVQEIWTPASGETVRVSREDSVTKKEEKEDRRARGKGHEEDDRQVPEKEDKMDLSKEENDDPRAKGDTNRDLDWQRMVNLYRYLLDEFETPPYITDATMEQLRRQAAPTKGGSSIVGTALFQLDLYLAQHDGIPFSGWGRRRDLLNHFIKIFCFTNNELRMLDDYLHLFNVLKVARNASVIGRRFSRKVWRAMKRADQYYRNPGVVRMETDLDFNRALTSLNIFQSNETLCELRNLSLRRATFRNVFVDFSWRWRVFLTSVKRVGIAGIPRDQVVNAMGALKRLEAHSKMAQDAFKLLHQRSEGSDDEEGSSTEEEREDRDDEQYKLYKKNSETRRG